MIKFILALCLSASICFSTPVQESAQFETDILSGKLEQHSEKALDSMIRLAAAELNKKGHSDESYELLNDWNSEYIYQFRDYANGTSLHNIGDHNPLSQWIADKYNMIEFILGVEICKQTHLSDIKTFNFCIPVVFRPCTFPMDSVNLPRETEYRNHFSRDPVYYGLVPVTSYWLSYGTCVAGTIGVGYVMVCGLAGSIVERLVGNFVSDNLSDKIYNKKCGG